jgi:Na+/H+ antiporter NhaD/arsenite permease-like protein
MLAAALGSYLTTRQSIHEANHFNFHPIQEVAILFIGIFATMMPALDWLERHARDFGSPTAGFFFWSSGTLSSVLDNAPTYLSFLKALFGTFVDPGIVQQVQHLIQNGGSDLAQMSEPARLTYETLQKYHAHYLVAKSIRVEQIEVAYLLSDGALNKYLAAISTGAVFFGANTYIGNGPNFMVKSIAHHQKIHTPTFLGYVLKYTLPYMVPMLVIIWLLFFRR